MKKFNLLFLLPALLLVSSLSAQRYMTQIFTQASTTTNVVYGSNFTVLTIGVPTVAHTTRQSLTMDVYQPDGDTQAERPLIIYCHTGSFLPWYNPATGNTINGSCGGTRNDPATVEMCTRLAKMGYVVANIDYRLGWRPDLTDESQRRFTLINAAYRGVQDVRTCIRFFHENVEDDGNEFRVDTSRIVVWGQGTGGYLSLNTAALDKYSEITNTSEPGKFIINTPLGPLPMIIEGYNGDPYGVQAASGVVDALYAQATGYPVGDTLYVQNHPGYSSDFKLAVNLGGALGDKNWIDENTPPILSYHVPADPFAPCGDGIVVVPGLNYAVVSVTGSCGVTGLQDAYDNNAVFEQGGLLTDPLSVYARTLNGGGESFYPFLRLPTDSAPWDWNTFIPTGAQNCVTDPTEPKTVIDTIIAYYVPRGCRALGLDCAGISTSTQGLTSVDHLLQLAPNPAQSALTFSTDADHPILGIDLYDVNGRRVRSIRNIQEAAYTLQRQGLTNGLYVAKVQFAEGVVARKLLFD